MLKPRRQGRVHAVGKCTRVFHVVALKDITAAQPEVAIGKFVVELLRFQPFQQVPRRHEVGVGLQHLDSLELILLAKAGIIGVRGRTQQRLNSRRLPFGFGNRFHGTTGNEQQ